MGKLEFMSPLSFLSSLLFISFANYFHRNLLLLFLAKLFLFSYFDIFCKLNWTEDKRIKGHVVIHSHVYIPFWVILQGVQGNASVVYDQDCIELAVKIHFCISNELEWLVSSRDEQLVQQAPHRARLLRLHLHHLCPLRLHRSQRCVTFMQFLKVQFW